MPERPPSEWFRKVMPSIRRQYPKRSKEDREQIAAGIWHDFSDKKQEQLTRKLEKGSSGLKLIIEKAIIAWKTKHIKKKHESRRKRIFRSKFCSLFVPIRPIIATKSVGDITKGDLVVEGFVSMPIKDLQGDVLELPALVKTKNEMVKAPHNLVWLDHESPYADPQRNQNTPPIGKFIYSKIVKWKGLPALWVRMLANKAHPNYKKIAYELKNGFYNAFSMEFIPVKEGIKYIHGKLANAISDIKYYATSLVRAPANEGASVTNVYTKAFANSSRFSPVRVTGPGWTGQTIATKGIKKMPKTKQTSEDEELEEEEEVETTQVDEDEESEEEEEVASESYGKAIKALARKQKTMEKLLKALAANTAMIGKSLGIDLKQVEEDEEVLPDEEAAGSSDIEEQEFPEVEYGEAGEPEDTEVIESAAEADDEDIESVEESSDVKSLRKVLKKLGLSKAVIAKMLKEVKSATTPLTPAHIKSLVRQEVARNISKKFVVRKGYGEYGGPIPESVKKMKSIAEDNGSIESQLEVIG